MILFKSNETSKSLSLLLETIWCFKLHDYILLVNNIDTKVKCRHLKNGPVKEFCGGCLSV